MPQTTPEKEPPSLSPVWMAVVLLLSAVAAVLLMLQGGWSAFVDDGGTDVPANMVPNIRFLDRATTWINQGLAGTAAWAAIAALAGFTVVELCRRQQNLPMSNRLRLLGSVAATVLACLELSGPVALVVGYVQLATDPTAARDVSSGLMFHGPLAVLCLVLAILAGLLGWVLWHAQSAGDEAGRREHPEKPSSSPQLTGTPESEAIEPWDIYRRPQP